MAAKFELHEESTMLYQGVRTENGSLKSSDSCVLYIIQHDDEQMLELVAYNEANQVEAPRLYVDCM